MKLTTFISGLLIALTATSNVFCTRQNGGATLQQAPNRETAFVDVNVIPMDGERVLANQTVLVRGDRIVEIGPAAKIKVPAGATRVNGNGKYLMPGLAEMHGHIPAQQSPREYVDAVLFLYVANGITTVRGMLGAPNQLELRGQAERGEIVSPTLYLAGPGFSGGAINSAAQAVERVNEQKREGWDLLKVLPGLTREEYDAMAKTARERGISFVGHIPEEVGLMHALEMRQETIDHVDGYVEYLQAGDKAIDEARLAEAVRKTKEAGTWIVPTMAVWEVLIGAASAEKVLAYPELKWMPRDQLANWEKSLRGRFADSQFDQQKALRVAAARKRILKALHEGGVRLLLGSDAPQQYSVPGFSIHREMALMRESGISNYEILRSGTKNVGDYFAAKDKFGTIAAGQRADLILVNADPLKDVANVAKRSGVMTRGRWMSEEEIQKRLTAIAESYAK